MIYIKRSNTLFLLILSLSLATWLITSSISTLAYSKATVDSSSDAQSFCRSLPEGRTVSNLGTCFYTAPGSVDKCSLTTTTGSLMPVVKNCSSFPLSNLIGNSSADLYRIIGYGDMASAIGGGTGLGPNVFTYSNSHIGNEAEAEAFCANLPDGVVHYPRNSQNTCYYKAATSSEPCTVTNRGGSVNASNCATYSINNLIGKPTNTAFTEVGYGGITAENIARKNPQPTVTPVYAENDCEGDDIKAGADNCAILDYIVLIIQVLTSIAGLAIVGSIVYAGIQYSAAGGDSQKVSAAKDRIRNAVIALLFLLFGFAILNYIIPGGVL